MSGWSTFADGEDCRDCMSYEKEIKKLKAERNEYREKCLRLTTALEVYAMTNETFPEYGTVARETLEQYGVKE